MSFSPEEREYARMVYEENAEHARLHGELRGMACGFLAAGIAGLLAANEKLQLEGKFIGPVILALSALGVLLNLVHYSRYERHRKVLTAFREALGRDLQAATLPELFKEVRKKHKNARPILSNLRLPWLRNVVYLVTAIAGLYLIGPCLAH